MSEKELDSSVNEYEEQYKSSNYVKQLQWDMAIGLQEVDNLKPSKYLEKLLEEEVEGNLTIEEVEKELKEYYIEKENKNEIKINREIKINNDNTDSLLNIIDMIIDSISDECTISIDLTDIKEGLASDKGIKYSYGEFDKNNSVEEIANKLEESAIKTSDELTGKKLMILVEMSSVYDIAYLNEVLNAIQDKSDDSYEAIFSLYLKEDLGEKIKVSLIYN